MDAVRLMYPNAKDPISYVRTNWSKEEHYYISFSHICPEEEENLDRKYFLDYDYNKLFFAGEHTYVEMTGTAHGAYISGKIAAS